jgi:hypothetical protein
LLAELEARTEKALADLGVKVAGDQVVNPAVTAPPTPEPQRRPAAAPRRKVA